MPRPAAHGPLSEYDLATSMQGGFAFPPAKKVPLRLNESTPILDKEGHPKELERWLWTKT